MECNEFEAILASVQKKEDYITQLCRDLGGADHLASTSMVDEIVALLEIIFHDQEAEWIAYWLWDLNGGENWKSGSITDDKGSIVLRTPGDLYQLLTGNPQYESYRAKRG
jgi:hypothetical protein